MKRIWIICLLAVFCLALPVDAAAQELETDRVCSLKLDYSQDGVAFPGLQIAVYRVAEAFQDGTFALIAPYDTFPVNIHGITSQSEWRAVATTLVSYVTAEQIAPTATAITDEQGMALLESLPTGLYLVRGAVAQNETGTYLFNDFMIYLPTPAADGSLLYELEAKPKCVNFKPAAQYRVVKLWKDLGLEEGRPVSVTVDIYQNGQLHTTVELNEDNQWSYSWSDHNGAQWHVVERNVPEGYQVSITEHETVFTITNTNPTPPPPPPSTGELFQILPLAMGLCLSGLALVLLWLRGNRHEKKA